ncbi:ABC transporter permease [Actinoplanes ianthinogenes]|uniref:ABC transporter permease n=1 Tax=Actinoplanes ianthinogenes TaxID=122358 RepID=A0ABM7LQB2_9ACTN|nr:ABC transporter permease [Actinoplanes ianthinogenes]BCJ41418.1 ABC transporter permease [Actinoplanes ianthinogenes]GGR30259.1 ABC transporter permease [Actinoplanes ianthinogenes]
MSAVLEEVLAGGVRLAAPLLLASAGELVSERAGVLNLSVEAMMLTGAFAGAAGAMTSGSALVGVGCALVAGLLVAALQALLSVTLRADQIVTGITANALALGATTYGARLLFADGAAGSLPGFGPAAIPLLSRIPLLGPALFDQTPLGYLAFALAIGLAFGLGRRFSAGLTIDAVGEDAVIADRFGLPVRRVRHAAILLTGLTAGLAGADLALAEVHTFSDNITGGIGYLAVVAVIAGRWRPWPTMLACVFFGIAQSLPFAPPALGLHVPAALLVTLPYVIALLAVSGLVGRSLAPSALTVPFAR